MKRSIFFAAIFASLVLSSVASANNGRRHHNSSEQTLNPRVGIDVRDFEDDDNDRPRKKRKFGQFGKIGQLVEKFANDNDEQQNPPRKPIDPGRGDGRVPIEPVAPQGRPGFVWVGDHWERERAPQKETVTPPARPGYVWVGDHWERERAPKQETVTPQGRPGYVWVGDHWERERAPQSSNVPSNGNGPIIRDHRTPKATNTPSSLNPRQPAPRPLSYPQFGTSPAPSRPTIVDHRRPAATVTVTSTPRPTRRPASNVVTGHGPLDGIVGGVSSVGGMLGDALGAAGNAVGIGHGSVTSARPAAPKRPAYKAPAGATVRDHR